MAERDAKQSEDYVAPEWQELNGDLLVEIAKRIRRSDDFIAFSGVCTSWRTAAAKENFMFCQVPWLMLAPRKDSHLRDFYDPWRRIIHQVNLSEAIGKRCYSSKGCLVTVGQDLKVSLFHPFSNLRGKLPHIQTIEDWDIDFYSYMYDRFIDKCVLSSSPLLASDYIVMVIFGGRNNLAYARAGDKNWTIISPKNYHDVIYYKERFYAVSCRGEVVACDIRGDNTSEIEEVANLPITLLIQQEIPGRRYIVESNGELLIISRYLVELENEFGKIDYTTSGFRVFKVDLNTKICTEIKDLGDRIIFLGHNSSFSVAARHSNCKPNSIYFTDDNMLFDEDDDGAGKDMGVYSLQDGSITSHFSFKSVDRITPPIWVEQIFI